MTIKKFIASARRYWKTFAFVAGVVFVLGLVSILLAPAKFVSTAQLMVSIDGSATAAAYQNDDVVAERINSYIALLTTDVVNQRVIDRLGLSFTAPELATKVSATNVPPKTAVIDVAVTDESPVQARLLANTLATEFVNYAEALETPTGEDGQKVHVRVVTAASEPREQRAERMLLGALTAIAALVLGAVAVWIRSRTDPVVRSADQAAAAAGLPVVGCVTSEPAADLEGYRRLRTRLSRTSPTSEAGDRGRVWVFASAVGEVDTGAVATNLGRAMELAGGRSIVLDAGIPEAEVASGDARPAADGNREAENEIGRNDGPKHASPELSIRRGADGFPDILSVNAWADDPDLSATVAAGLLDRLRNEYAHVIVAGPPVLKTITSSVVSEYADAVLLVLSVGTTRRRDLICAADDLRATGAPLTGAVLSETKPITDVVCSDNDGKRSDTVGKAHALTSDQ